MVGGVGIKAVVVGGGTGTFTVLSALKHYVSHVTAIINMVDDGGSTGILRDELGVLPPGDVRQSLVALSPDSSLMREVLNYRFDTGTFEGHAFGNLLLTVLEKVTGSFAEAVHAAAQLLSISGAVVPVTTKDTRLCLRLPGGEVIRGERVVQQEFWETGARPDVFLEPPASLNPDAARAIREADLLVMGPGNFYSSLVPHLLVKGYAEALRASKGVRVYVCNLVNKPGQTDGFMVHDFPERLEALAGGPLFDYVVYDDHRPPEELLTRYRRAGEEWVEHDPERLRGRSWKAVGGALLSSGAPTEQPRGDTLIERSLIRHDSDRLARLLLKVYFS